MVTSLNSRVASGVATLFSRPKNTSVFGSNALGRTPGLPSLAFDFTNGNSLDSRITFTRASSATYFGSDGLLKTAANDAPRFDYDPVTLQPKGLLIEEQRTNLLTYSEQFDNAAWTKQAGRVTANSTISPDGTTTADTYTASAVTGIHAILQTAAALASGRVASVYVKAGTHRYVQISFNGDATAWANFDVIAGAGVVGSVGKNQTASIIDSGNGWYRCVVYTDSTTATNFYFSVVDSSESVRQQSWAASGTESVYIWGAQLEAGAFPTSYIPTTSAQATRAADVATMTGTNFSSWYNQNEGTLFAEFDVVGLGSTTNYNGALSVDDGSINNAIELSMWDAASDGLRWVGYVGGTPQWSINPKNYLPNSVVKGAGTYKANSFNAAFDGVLGAEDTLGSVPVVNLLRIGVNRGGNSNYLNGHIKRLAYYPKRLSNTELQALTG